MDYKTPEAKYLKEYRKEFSVKAVALFTQRKEIVLDQSFLRHAHKLGLLQFLEKTPKTSYLLWKGTVDQTVKSGVPEEEILTSNTSVGDVITPFSTDSQTIFEFPDGRWGHYVPPKSFPPEEPESSYVVSDQGYKMSVSSKGTKDAEEDIMLTIMATATNSGIAIHDLSFEVYTAKAGITIWTLYHWLPGLVYFGYIERSQLQCYTESIHGLTGRGLDKRLMEEALCKLKEYGPTTTAKTHSN